MTHHICYLSNMLFLSVDNFGKLVSSKYLSYLLLLRTLLLTSKMTTPNYSNGNWSLDFPNESVKIIHWHGFFSIILICLCSAFAIISTAGKSTIIYFILYKAPKRPMNTMILLDQVGTLVTSLVAKVMIITCLIMGIPILDLLGPLACEVFYIFTIAHNILIATGGFFMAVFRMLCVQFQNYVPSVKSLRNKRQFVVLI